MSPTTGVPQKLQFEFELGTPLKEIVNQLMRCVILAKKGNRSRAARALDITSTMILNRLGPQSAPENFHELARSGDQNVQPAGAGHGQDDVAVIPSRPGGQEKSSEQ